VKASRINVYRWTESRKGYCNKLEYIERMKSRISSVSIESKLGAGQPRNWCSIPGMVMFLLFSVRTGSEVHPAYPMGTGVKWPGRKVDHSLPFCSVDKKAPTRIEMFYTEIVFTGVLFGGLPLEEYGRRMKPT
jgi:hypothetical protein